MRRAIGHYLGTQQVAILRTKGVGAACDRSRHNGIVVAIVDYDGRWLSGQNHYLGHPHQAGNIGIDSSIVESVYISHAVITQDSAQLRNEKRREQEYVLMARGV